MIAGSINPKQSISLTRYHQTRSDATTERWLRNVTEARIGGFWYGSVRNDRLPQYCKKWNNYLKERIRAYWGWVSTLSGESETTLGSTGRIAAISCHHVYYQKAACCMWDEDEHEYYINLNTVGSTRNPIWERYYIEDGNPNKFVTLTRKEHRATDTNKIHWIKVFEQIIVDNGGKCYLSDEDVVELYKMDTDAGLIEQK